VLFSSPWMNEQESNKSSLYGFSHTHFSHEQEGKQWQQIIEIFTERERENSFFLSVFLSFFLATCLHPWTCVGGIQTNAKNVFLPSIVCLPIYFFPSFICVQVRNYFATPAKTACGHTGVCRQFQTKNKQKKIDRKKERKREKTLTDK